LGIVTIKEVAPVSGSTVATVIRAPQPVAVLGDPLMLYRGNAPEHWSAAHAGAATITSRVKQRSVKATFFIADSLILQTAEAVVDCAAHAIT
jgi:hypothetical protein